MNMDDNFTVFTIPDYRNNNPYQELLAGGLEKIGTGVVFNTPSSVFFPFKVMFTPGKKVLHIHWLGALIGSRNIFAAFAKPVLFIIFLLLAKLGRTKLIWTVHNLTSHDAPHPGIEIFFTRIISNLLDKVIIHCPFVAEELGKLYNIERSKIDIISHGSYVEFYPQTITRKEARGKLSLPDEGRVFLTFGSMKKYKGVENLIETFKSLKEENIFLLIAGEPEKGAVSLIKEEIRNFPNIKAFLSFIPEEEVEVFMEAADIVVLPYADVLTSGAAMLAASFSKAVIAPKIGCLPYELDEGGSIFYEREGENNLYKALKYASGCDLEKLEDMGRRNLRKAKGFDWSEIASLTKDVYRKSF